MEFTSADIFQHSSFGDILNSLRSLSLSGEPWSNYILLEWDADDEEIRCPPTTHLVATVDDLTDMLDFGSEDFDGMDDEAGDESSGLATRLSQGVKSVSGSIATESAASMVGSIRPSSDGAIYSGLKAGVVAGVIS